MTQTNPIPSPEQTGVYCCPKCSNGQRFTGIDAIGYGGPEDCKCGRPEGRCSCTTELKQDFYVNAVGEVIYQEFTGGESGAEIGAYTKIICRQCGAVVWEASAK